MTKYAIIYSTQALISSAHQINLIEEKFRRPMGETIGNKTALFASNLKTMCNSGDIHFEPVYKTFEQISKICKETNSDAFFRIMGEFFKFYSIYLNMEFFSNGDKEHKSSPCTQTTNNEPQTLNDGDVDSSDDDCIILESHSDTFKSSSNANFEGHRNIAYIAGLQYALQQLNPVVDEIMPDLNEYDNELVRGFIQCISIGILECTDTICNNDEIVLFTKFTNTIEELASQNKNIDNKTVANANIEKLFIYNSNGSINPVVQIIATTLRSILEAIKVKT